MYLFSISVIITNSNKNPTKWHTHIEIETHIEYYLILGVVRVWNPVTLLLLLWANYPENSITKQSKMFNDCKQYRLTNIKCLILLLFAKSIQFAHFWEWIRERKRLNLDFDMNNDMNSNFQNCRCVPEFLQSNRSCLFTFKIIEWITKVLTNHLLSIFKRRDTP